MKGFHTFFVYQRGFRLFFSFFLRFGYQKLRLRKSGMLRLWKLRPDKISYLRQRHFQQPKRKQKIKQKIEANNLKNVQKSLG